MHYSKILSLQFFIIVTILIVAICAQNDLYDPYENNPKIFAKNGHLVISSGRNKDLQLRSYGSGQIKLNGNALSTGDNEPSEMMVSMARSIDRRFRLIESRFLTKIDQLNGTIAQLGKTQSSAKMRKRVRFLLKRLTKLEKLLNKDECSSNPCQHGGVCEDGFNRYICRCAEGYQGKNCEQDIDECARFQGTDMGCQNGGTCLNTFGSFRCLCPPNYQGRHCAALFNDCHNSSNTEICDHGVCIDLPRKEANKPRYRCACFQGWKKSLSGENAPCDADFDECASGQHKCSRIPLVRCINLVPGYDCGPCPAGYSGDGFTCVPYDDCLQNNGGCSLSPRVACYSSPSGGVTCGTCPSGYTGDGRTCTPLDGDICSINNGGCSSNARCRPNTAISAVYRDCICPDGFTGNGIGPRGCTVQRSTLPTKCLPDTCKNGGSCTELRNRAWCFCIAGFNGPTCEDRDSCSRNPCKNGGRCLLLPLAGYTCVCTNEYSGPNCEQSRSSCGGSFNSQSGVLTYPITNGSSYGNNITCEWIIRSTLIPGKVLNITFTRFKIEQSSRCAFDYVELYDGPSREYNSFGRFCGDTLPARKGGFISSFNTVLVRFKSDISVAMDGFELLWSTIEPTCGGMLANVTHGMLESPGFPHHYPNNIDCYWKIVGDYGKRIQFVFTHLDIEPSGNCSYDYLEFREGFRGEGEQIAKFCNWTASPEYSVPPPITSAGSIVRVHFHSDSARDAKGFKLMFHQVPGICGGLLTGAEGIFRPPSMTYTSPSTGKTVLVYQNNIVCDWIIRALPDERISLKFLSFALEADGNNNNRVTTKVLNTTNCLFDFVEVYDGKEPNSPLRARLCGRIRPPEIISSGRFLRVKFRSDLSVSLRGFVAKYTALCGGEFNEPSGSIESPNYPAPTLMSKNCTYLITVPLGYVVRLNVTSMDIEYDHRCAFDYLLIDDQRYCGKVSPPIIISDNNELRITYVNDETRPSRGFQASWDSVEIGCGGVLNQGNPPVIISPSQMRDEPPVNQCLWEIRARSGYVIRLKFLQQEFGVRTSDSRSNSVRLNPLICDFNKNPHVLVNDSDGVLINRFCLDKLPLPLTSSGRKLFVTYIFKNKYSATNQSAEQWINDLVINLGRPRTFSANYFFIPDQAVCGRNLFSNSGIIRSPQFPRRYPPSRNCTWIIHVDNGLQIKLNFTKFHLEPPSDTNGLCYDYLEIRNGRRSDSPLIGMFCSTGPLPNIVSHSNYLFLRFFSDSSTQYYGFEVRYEALSQSGCGGTLTSESGTIESPDYPNSYIANLNCEWKIRVAAGSLIQLSFESLSLESVAAEDATCNFDYLELFDGENDDAPVLGRVCNMQNLLMSRNKIQSKTNTLFIRFTSDATVSQGGFKLNYFTVCNRTIVGRYGIIESPNYPEPHPHNMNCTWRIIVPRGNNVSLAFAALNLEPSTGCSFDFLNISQVDRRQQIATDQINRIDSPFFKYNISNVSLFCGDYTEQLPKPILTKSNEILINFVSDETQSVRSGFRLEWAARGCGAEYINRDSGTIMSPNFPNPYPFDTECLWHIRAPNGRRVDLLINQLDLEYSKSCVFDYLEVYGGRDEKSPKIARLCNQVSGVHLTSVGNWMTLKMYSDLSAPRRGFNATFSTTNTGCGGLYISERGTIFSPNYGRGNQYEKNSECNYKIQTEGDFVIELRVNDLDIPGEMPNCSQGYLAVYRGSQESYEKDNGDDSLWKKYCGNLGNEMKEIKILSNDSIINLRFQSDSEHFGRGFNATYKRVCGKTIIVDDRDDYRTISSPDYPHMSASQDEKCRFILKAAKPTDRIAIRFTHIQAFNFPVQLDARATNTCLISFVDFYEGLQEIPEKRLDHYCAQFIPRPIMSNGDTLLLVSHYTIFQAYVSTAKSFCGGDFFANDGYITTPGYPNNYPANIECIWMLNAAPGNRFGLEIVDFGLESSEFCNNDYVEIRQHNSSGPLIGDRRLCGTKDDIPDVFDIPYVGNVWIKFRTDSGGTGTGFMFRFYNALNVMLTDDSGQIASPGYPNTFHFYNRSFTWSVVTSPSTYIKLEFIEFDLMGTVPNCFTQLSIFNGIIDFQQMDPSRLTEQNHVDSFPVNALPKPKAYYCGNELPKTFIADGNAVTLTYTTNYYSHFQPGKFLLKYSTINATEIPTYEENYEGVPTNLNSTFKIFVKKGENFTLSHENYTTDLYGSSIDWYFETVPSMHFNISVARISFLPATSCWLNHFHLYTWKHWDRKWIAIRNYCNGYSGITEIPGTAAVRMHLQHIRSNELGFIRPRYNITLYPVCGGNFTEPSGYITMDDFNDSHNSLQCTWSVKVKSGRTIRITVEYYSIGRESLSCSQEYLQIRNGQSDDSPLLVQTLCGHNTTAFTLPETSANHAFIRVLSTQPNNNFRIHYEEVGLTCGGELVLHSSLDSIQFSSPEYPDSPSHDVVCEWVIRGPLDSGLQINFQQEHYTTCDSKISYIQIFNGGSDLSTEIGKYCAPPYNLNTVVIESNVGFVRFVMDERNFRAKFNASVHVDRCHREYYVGTSIRELSLPVSDYSIASGMNENQKCTIQLRTHPNYYITLNLTYANLEGDNCTAGDVIQFYDSSKSTFSFERLCPGSGDLVGQSVTSVESGLLISYERINYSAEPISKSNNTNRTSNGKPIGIKFRVQTKYRKCQQTIDARMSPSGTIRSPNYPSAVNRRLSCYWRLMGEPGTRFYIRFLRFELGTPPPPKIATKKCKKELRVWPNLYSPKHMVKTYGCQQDLPPDSFSLTNMMMLSLYARELAEREGFVLQYRTVFDNESCSARLDQPRGTVESYQFGNVNSSLIGCAWEVAVGANQSATFLIDTYDVPGDCFNSSLTTTGLSENSLYFWSVICITQQTAPQITGKKYIMPIMAKPDEVHHPFVLLNFNGTGTNHKGLRGEYFIHPCGGVYTDFEGSFQSPNYPQSFPEPIFCHWFFQLSDAESDTLTTSGYKLTFSEFELHDNCDQEYFLVKPRFEAQSLHHLCALDGMPREIFVGHDLLLSFVSSRNLSTTGVEQSPGNGPKVRRFAFKIERQHHGCGGLLLSRWGYFQSPNYANLTDAPPNQLAKNTKYPSNSECIWLVKAIPDFHLEFTFHGRFDLEQSSNCTADYLQFEERRISYIGEKQVDLWNVLNRTCGPKTPSPIVSNTNLVRVTFRSNDKIVGDGFRVTYEQKCGGLFEGENGTIVSPHYSQGAYGSELTCVYKLQRQAHEYIQIEFEDFDLEYHQNCIFDSLWIYLGDHQNKTTPKYGPYCGTSLPPKLSASGLLTIVFHSDHFVSKRGFKLHFGITSCGGNISATSGEIVAPPYLRTFSGCLWRIETPKVNSSLALRIVDLELANEHCRSDCCNTLIIAEGSSIYDAVQLGSLCSNNHADLAYKATGNRLIVQLSKGLVEGGFEARFKIVFWTTPGPKQGCGGSFNAVPEGAIQSPDIDGDSFYEPDLDCVWSISAKNVFTQFIELSFERFDVEAGNSSECDNDYLDIYDGTTMHSPMLARLCGRDSIPEKIQSSSETLLLHFVSNSAISGHGFRARFALKNQTCGGLLFPKETPQVITSPGFPAEYPIPAQCQWKLVNSYFYGQPLVLTFHTLDMNCSRGDYVQIASQPLSNMDYLVKRPITLCSSSGKVKVISNEKMLLNFKTFETIHPGGSGYDNANFMQNTSLSTKSKYTGFNLTYHFSLCNETIDGLDNGFVMSNNFPQEQNIYREHVCFINITVPRGRRIALYLSRFQFYQCQYSNMTIYEPALSTKARATFCDMHGSPAPYFSETNMLTIAVKASRMKLNSPDDYRKPDYKRNRILYSLNYYSNPLSAGPAGCGGNLTGSFGMLSSPKYPAVYDQNNNCTWIITSNGYHTINLTFEFFRLSSGCDDNRLEIFDGNEQLDDKKITTLCYKDEPKNIVSNSNSLLIKMYSSKNNYASGFLATYRVNTKAQYPGSGIYI